MKKMNILPNILTSLGLSCGLFVIFKLNMTAVGQANEMLLIATAGILLLAALFDLLDGAVARAMQATSEFGGLFDSLADAVSFGVAPPVIVLKSLSVEPGTFASFLLTTAALVYSLCGVLRLVRFSSTKSDPTEELEVAKKNNFTGLPIPAAAGALVSLNLLLASSDIHNVWSPSPQQKLYLLGCGMFVLGSLMISRWKFPSAKNLHIRVASFQLVFATVLFSVFIFYGLIHHFALVFTLLSWAYVTIPLFLSFLRYLLGKRASSLADFEPDADY